MFKTLTDNKNNRTSFLFGGPLFNFSVTQQVLLSIFLPQGVYPQVLLSEFTALNILIQEGRDQN